jgi:hypothetical protein
MKALLSEQKLKEMHFRVLKAEKESVELEIELRRLKKFLTKNMDVSAIDPTFNNRLNLDQHPTSLHIQNANISTSFNRLLPG